MRTVRVLPADRHIGFDGFLSRGEVAAGVEHIEADRVEFVAGGACEAIAGNIAGSDFALETEQSFGDDPDIPGASRDSQHLFVGIVFLSNVLGLFMAGGPADHNVRLGFDFEERHDPGLQEEEGGQERSEIGRW